MAAFDQERAANPAELEDASMEETTKEEIEKDAYYNVQAIVRSKYHHEWRFSTLWEGYGMEETT